MKAIIAIALATALILSGATGWAGEPGHEGLYLEATEVELGPIARDAWTAVKAAATVDLDESRPDVRD